MSIEDYNFAKAREAWATPVKIVQYNCLCGRTMKFESEHGVIAPQRTWVGLTPEELNMIGNSMRTWNSWSITDVYTAIEAKLKEKNQ
jgi:hypothetical protein